MRKFVKVTLGILLVLLGLGLYLYPTVSDWLVDRHTKQYIEEFTQTQEEHKEIQKKEKNVKTKDPLYREIAAYNEKIYKEKQKGFRDAWSYEQAPVSVAGLEDGRYGYIRIPAMDLKLPLYIGANDANMARGAAILGQTSIPIGGKNTNSVISGHRGWVTGSFFKDIEKVSVGDLIYITNPWETLTYRAESIDIVSPYASDKMKIQKGRDMITLLTCHPYLSHGKMRYVIYCVRDESGKKHEKQKNTDTIVASDGTVYASSNDLIDKENLLRRISAFAILGIVLISCIYSRIRKKREGSSE